MRELRIPTRKTNPIHNDVPENTIFLLLDQPSGEANTTGTLISKIDEVPGLILACGFTGHGFGIAPVVGKLLSELGTDQQTTLDLKEFRYDRFKAVI